MNWYAFGGEESVSPEDFRKKILEDQLNEQGEVTHKGLKRQLAELAGLSAGEVPDLATDPTKCIVLCYGVPILIRGSGVTCGVDASLSLLFNETEWGRMPFAGYPSAIPGRFQNPYYEPQVDPAQRTKPEDFGEFRASSYNRTTEPAPNFTIVRLLDSTHALRCFGIS